MVQDQQAQLITHQGHMKVPVEKMYCLFKPRELPLPWEHAQPTTHSPALTAWLSWDSTCTSSELLQVSCQSCHWRPLRNDWPPGKQALPWGRAFGIPVCDTAWLSPVPGGLSFLAVRLPRPTTAYPEGNTLLSPPVPWSFPKHTATLPGNEITAIHRTSKLSDDELH